MTLSTILMLNCTPDSSPSSCSAAGLAWIERDVDDEVAPGIRSDILLVEVSVGLILALVSARTGSRDCRTGLEEEQEQRVGVQQLWKADAGY